MRQKRRVAAPRNIVYFDLETQKLFQQVGRGRCEDLKMSVGVTCSARDGEYRIYLEDDVNALIEELTRADLVVGFNHIGFDYQVLAGYTVRDLGASVPSLDMMVALQGVLGFRIGLDALATATLGIGKTGDGREAVKWWNEGKLEQIAEYCCFDVKVTRLLYEFGARHGVLFYRERQSGRIRQVAVPWKGAL